MDLTPDQLRTLGGAARYVAYRDSVSVAGAAERIRKQPQLLSDLSLEVQALREALVPEIANETGVGTTDDTENTDDMPGDPCHP